MTEPLTDPFYNDNMVGDEVFNDFGDVIDLSKFFSSEGLTNTDDAPGIVGTNADAGLLNLQPSTQPDLVHDSLTIGSVLESELPVSELEPEELAPIQVTNQPTRQPRRRVAREHWGESSQPVFPATIVDCPQSRTRQKT